jgi:hypothetical protein
LLILSGVFQIYFGWASMDANPLFSTRVFLVAFQLFIFEWSFFEWSLFLLFLSFKIAKIIL